MTHVICPNCGRSTTGGKFCEHCGASVQTFQQPAAQQPVYTSQPDVTKKMRNATIAAILSVWIGLGQAYNGQLAKGWGLFAVWFFMFRVFYGGVEFYFNGVVEYFSVFVLMVWVYSAYDAYSTSKKLNSGALPYKEIKASKIVGFIIGSIIIGFILTVLVYGTVLLSMYGTCCSVKTL